MSAGHWHTPWHGAFEMTTEDMAEYVSNFDQGIGLVAGSKKAPVNYGHDITGKAAGWITRLFIDNDGTELWGDVSWTPEGKRMLADEEFKYISPEWNPRAVPWENPEEDGDVVNNVFTGAGLTNIPLFTKLKPVMASIVIGSSDNNKGDTQVNLEEARKKKVDELTDDEKTFLEEHKADLTDEERATFGLADEPDGGGEGEDDGEGEQVNDADNQPPKVAANAKVIQISASQLIQLKADAKAGREASDKLAHNEATALVEKHITAGRIKSSEAENTVNMLLASTGDQRKAIETHLDALPANPLLAGEKGSSKDGAAEDASDELMVKAAAVVKESGGKTTLAEATKQILASNTDLRDRVNAERSSNA